VFENAPIDNAIRAVTTPDGARFRPIEMESLTHYPLTVVSHMHGDALLVLVEAICEALPENVDANGADRTPADPATVAALLARLKRLLETDDGEAAEFIVDARPSLSGALTAAEIESLSERVGNFDFEAALECLSRIVDRLGLHLKNP